LANNHVFVWFFSSYFVRLLGRAGLSVANQPTTLFKKTAKWLMQQ
jgi:hypothetical protein